VPLPLDLLDPDEARDLLGQRLGVDRVGAEPVAVEEIVDRCVRLPLALAVVAARAAAEPRWPLAALATELGHLHDRLDALATGDAGTDVRSVFSCSYGQLSEPAARLFRLLGLHPGPDLSVSAAASLAGIPPARVRPMLAELVRAYLVTERVPGRYALHDLLRAYAAEQAARSEPQADRQVALRRLLDHYLHGAHRADAVLKSRRSEVVEPVPPLVGVTLDDLGSAAVAADWIAAEYPVIAAAVQVAIDAGLDRHAWQLVWSIAPYGERHQDFHGALTLHRVGLQAAERLDDLPAQGYSHRRCGQVCTIVGAYDEALTHLEQALELYRQLGDDLNQAHVCVGLGMILDRQGRYREALHQSEQALTRYRTSGHRVWQAHALNNLSWLHTRLGNYESALKPAELALTLLREDADRRAEASTFDSLGFAYHHLGQHANAITAYQQALTSFRDLGLRYFGARTLTHLGDTYEASGQIGAARDCWEQALVMFAEFDYPDAEQVRERLRSVPYISPS
jgi:tetratricopeptide (TPR) repeat protein